MFGVVVVVVVLAFGVVDGSGCRSDGCAGGCRSGRCRRCRVEAEQADDVVDVGLLIDEVMAVLFDDVVNVAEDVVEEDELVGVVMVKYML